MSRETSRGPATVRQLCQALCISKQAYYQARKRRRVPARTSTAPPRKAPPNLSVSDAELRKAIERVRSEEPAEAWGHRKVWAILRHQEDLRVGHNRVWKMMGALGLLQPVCGPHSLHAREGTVAVPESNRRWGTDLTTVWTRQDGQVAVAPVIDFGDRFLLGVGVSESQEAEMVLAPVRTALHETFGASEDVVEGLELRMDHGPQYTGAVCHALCKEWGVEQSFAPVGRPTGNAITERIILTMKAELIWARDWESAQQLRDALEAWRHTYNHRRPHESLGWRTPAQKRDENLKAATGAAA
jgi:putative transposase